MRPYAPRLKCTSWWWVAIDHLCCYWILEEHTIYLGHLWRLTRCCLKVQQPPSQPGRGSCHAAWSHTVSFNRLLPYDRVDCVKVGDISPQSFHQTFVLRFECKTTHSAADYLFNNKQWSDHVSLWPNSQAQLTLFLKLSRMLAIALSVFAPKALNEAASMYQPVPTSSADRTYINSDTWLCGVHYGRNCTTKLNQVQQSIRSALIISRIGLQMLRRWSKWE